MFTYEKFNTQSNLLSGRVLQQAFPQPQGIYKGVCL